MVYYEETVAVIEAKRVLSALLIGQLVCMVAIIMHSEGMLQPLELIAYDTGVRVRAADGTIEDRVFVINMTETDITRFSWPISDDILAEMLEKLDQAKPRAIGIDIYRDHPTPPGTERLKALLSERRDLVWGYLFGATDGYAIRPPEGMQSAEQKGFVDVTVDPDGVLRRAILFMHDQQGQSHTSLPAVLAFDYLSPFGIFPVPDPEEPDNMRLGRTTIPPIEPTEGGYAGADARGYQILLDYRLGAEPFKSVSLADFMDGKVPPAMLSDRIVLVGVTAESIKDYFMTPLRAGSAPATFSHGVTLHAHVITQLLHMALDGKQPMVGIRDRYEILGIWLAGTLGSLIGLTLRGALPLGLVAMGGMAALALGWYGAFVASFWLPLAAPMLAWVVVLGLVAGYLSQVEHAEWRILMQLFASHLSDQVAQEIWRHRAIIMKGGRPKPMRLTATVMFSDMAGFTTISESLDPEILTSWLNEYMNAMSRIVLAHGGIVLQFVGDGILAAFGIPIPRSDEGEIDRDAARAVRCAMAMEQELRSLKERWEREGLPVVAIRVGIHTGVMVAANIGASTHWEYALVGDSVIIAARLQALPTMLPGFVNDAPCCILVGESTWQRLRGEFHGCLLGNMALKGKKRKVKVYQIVTDDVETDTLLAAAEYNKRVESVSDRDPKRIEGIG
jgi:CHASE2 domain-containing sensor protein/class 3 adenylate cyclase